MNTVLNKNLCVVILILTAIMPSYICHAETSRDKMTRIKINHLHSSVQQYYIDFGAFPDNKRGFMALIDPPRIKPDSAPMRPYLKSIPLDAWGEQFIYRRLEGNLSHPFIVYSKGKDRKEGTVCDIYIQGYVPDTPLKPCDIPASYSIMQNVAYGFVVVSIVLIASPILF